MNLDISVFFKQRLYIIKVVLQSQAELFDLAGRFVFKKKHATLSYIFSRLKDDLDLGLPIKYHHHRKDIIRLFRDYLGVVITPKMFRTSTATILSDEGV